MLFIFGNAETRRLPGRFQVPWKEIRLGLSVLAILAVVAFAANAAFSRASDEPAAPAVPAIQPVAQPFDPSTSLGAQGKPVQQVPTVVAPTTTLLTLRWEDYDWEKNPLGLGEYYAWGMDKDGAIYGIERYGGAIVYGEFIGTGRTKDTIVYLRTGTTIRREDIEANLAYSPEFSPDKGKTWFVGGNIPVGAFPSFVQVGAVFDGEDILLLAHMAYEPWKYRHYVARVTPQDTKRASQ